MVARRWRSAVVVAMGGRSCAPMVVRGLPERGGATDALFTNRRRARSTQLTRHPAPVRGRLQWPLASRSFPVSVDAVASDFPPPVGLRRAPAKGGQKADEPGRTPDVFRFPRPGRAAAAC